MISQPGTDKLLFVWTDPIARRRHVVGHLYKQGNVYTFQYAKDISVAKSRFFTNFPAFPDLDQVYSSTGLFPAFERRLPSPKRPDYAQVLQRFGLTPPVESWDLLRVTGGRLATDEFEFAMPLKHCGNSVEAQFYIAGWRYHGAGVPPMQYRLGAELEVRPEPTNEQDPSAHAIHTLQGSKLGYVPAFYAQTLAELRVKASAVVAAFDEDAGLNGALYVHLKGAVPDGVLAHPDLLDLVSIPES